MNKLSIKKLYSLFLQKGLSLFAAGLFMLTLHGELRASEGNSVTRAISGWIESPWLWNRASKGFQSWKASRKKTSSTSPSSDSAPIAPPSPRIVPAPDSSPLESRRIANSSSSSPASSFEAATSSPSPQTPAPDSDSKRAFEPSPSSSSSPKVNRSSSPAQGKPDSSRDGKEVKEEIDTYLRHSARLRFENDFNQAKRTHTKPEPILMPNTGRLSIGIPETTQKVVNNLTDAIERAATHVTQGSAQLHKLLYTNERLNNLIMRINEYSTKHHKFSWETSSPRTNNGLRPDEEKKAREEKASHEEGYDPADYRFDTYLDSTPSEFVTLIHEELAEIYSNFVHVISIYNLPITSSREIRTPASKPSIGSNPKISTVSHTAFKDIEIESIKIDQSLAQEFIAIAMKLKNIVESVKKSSNDDLIMSTTKLELKTCSDLLKEAIHKFQTNSLGGAYGTIIESIDVLKAKLLDVSADISENLSVKLRKQLSENIGFSALLSMEKEINALLESPREINQAKIEELVIKWHSDIESIIESIRHTNPSSQTKFEQRITILLTRLDAIDFSDKDDPAIRLTLRSILPEIRQLNATHGGLLGTLESTAENLSSKLRKQLIELVGFPALFYIHRDISELLAHPRSITYESLKDTLSAWRKRIREIKNNIAHDNSENSTKLEKNLRSLLSKLADNQFQGKDNRAIREQLIRVQAKFNLMNNTNGGLFMAFKGSLDEAMKTFSDNLKRIVHEDFVDAGEKISARAFHYAKRTALFATSLAITVGSVKHIMKNYENPKALKVGCGFLALSLLYPAYEGVRSLWNWIKSRKKPRRL